ncbi:DegV family protein [Peptostreptococcus equinus]|uniref:DegV family protein n=1 Tax=Peptostreptococcus equinus TaxID=3003601 RepID=A0ABY7JR96_9FIRM|nr:DegV family protein [Peptostreptococcus sp. CBA3647]WAW15016.1 DegV family protein [Peptostreptococcus sp. CBA3647]
MNYKTAIIVDTGTDISLNMAKEYGIELIPLTIRYTDREYKDMLEIEAKEVYDNFENEIPKTSLPSIGEVIEILENLHKKGYEEFIIITISSGLSGTYQVCYNALKELAYKGEVIDTKRIGLMSGCFGVFASKLRSKGYRYEEICDIVKNNLDNCYGYYTLENLKYLIKGGRIGHVDGALANLLNIKPVISCNDEGVYYTVKKARGRKNSIKEISKLIKEKISDDPYWIMLCEGNSPEGINYLKSELKEELKKAEFTVTNQITATLGVHTGPGLVSGILFKPQYNSK